MKKYIVIGLCIIAFGVLSFKAITTVLAEQAGSSPESGATSRISTLVADLISKSYGSDVSGDWGDWGAVWNRIYSSATWSPNNANAVASDVAVGKTFYSGIDRTIKTGTYNQPQDYSLFINQYYCVKENTGAPCLGLQNAAVPASSWTNTNTTSGLFVWKDDRTGLYWTDHKSNGSNSFSLSCGYYYSTPRGAWGGTGCGTAIDYCSSLSQATETGGIAKTNWYLPTLKELLQAYNDDIYNKTGQTFANASTWSSSESNSYGSTYAWAVNLSTGSSGIFTKSTGAGPSNVQSIRCVSRD